MTSIRRATGLDRDRIHELYLRTFPAQEGPDVARLAVSLLDEDTGPETISLVAELNGALVGHIAFSPVTADTDSDWMGYILAPLGVDPGYQKRRIGTKLVESGLAQLSESGVKIVFVYGDPKYYGKFGFEAETAASYLPPYELQYPFGWQAIFLRQAEPVGQPAGITCVASLQDPALW